MEDKRIVDLYWQRSEDAIRETQQKYGGYCYSIAYNILADAEDARESVNDTWLGAWNSMPAHRPGILSTYLAKITRRLSIKKWQEKYAAKRGGGQTPLVLDELSDCIPSDQNVEKQLELQELTDILNDFILALPMTEMRIFVCRYWYLDPISEIARRFDFTPSKVKSMLYRTRQKLLLHLKVEGVYDD